MLTFKKAKINEFLIIKNFYWNLIDVMIEENSKIGWKKGIYPTDAFIQNSLIKGELFTLKENGKLLSCVIINNLCNEGYKDVNWSLVCSLQDVLIPHALAVSPEYHKKGIGKKTVEEILRYAKSCGKKAVRLDILGTNTAAERLYTKCGFKFVQAKAMFYEDTGLTEYKLYEFNFI